MKLIQITATNFDLAKTLSSGQVFHWEVSGKGFCGTIGDVAVYVEQQNQTLLVESGAPATPGSPAAAGKLKLAPPFPELVRHYFALDHPLEEICRSFPDDPVMSAARDYCRGLRIIRQPKWECLATFICSSMKQVAHIRQISRALRVRFGERLKMDQHVLFTFPSAKRLAKCSEKELRECALGYRAKNLLATARLVADGEADLESWTGSPDSDLREHLCQLPGVGSKVANCVMLFAFERLRSFPIDVWIERVLRGKYFAGKKRPTAEKLRAFAQRYFGQYGGYAQQYLFHHARTTQIRRRGDNGKPVLNRSDQAVRLTAKERNLSPDTA